MKTDGRFKKENSRGLYLKLELPLLHGYSIQPMTERAGPRGCPWLSQKLGVRAPIGSNMIMTINTVGNGRFPHNIEEIRVETKVWSK